MTLAGMASTGEWQKLQQEEVDPQVEFKNSFSADGYFWRNGRHQSSLVLVMRHSARYAIAQSNGIRIAVNF
jgi:hypothetical protein